MNWPHFILYAAGIYLSYYPAMILYDALSAGSDKKPALQELTFFEEVQPKSVGHFTDKEQPPAIAGKQITPEPAAKASGGVSLKDLFNLCREEAIIYTRPVSF